MTTPAQAWHLDNLRLAWLRVRSNADRTYKGYFRDLYTAYSVADEGQLKHLQNRLKRGIFDPTDSCKVFFPKQSGVLRPYSLLAVEDQIVYQAIANSIAEKLYPRVRKRYNKEVFGHLYAGSASPWFYRRWSEGYGAFNKAAGEAFNSGYTWTASFDLTACYDSIDHHVLRKMITEIGVSHELANQLTDFLTRWTATDTQIYHNHGIPQGPLSSGLIAESVLRYFDENRGTKHDVKYFRYVDDIRLFAKDQRHLRYALVALDLLSKDVGLFPQSGKIYIHEVVDIATELKSISNPIEPVLSVPEIDQHSLRRRLAELTPGKKGYIVTDSTRFKFLMSRATPSAQLLDRLWKVYERAPHYYTQLAQHLSKFKSIPDKHARRLVVEVRAQELYPAIQAAFIRASVGRMPQSAMKFARAKLKPLWRLNQNQADLSEALWLWLVEQSHFTDSQVKYALVKAKPNWLRMSLLHGADWGQIAAARRTNLLNESLRASSPDVAISAAWLCVLNGVPVQLPVKSIQANAKILLKGVGLVRRPGPSVCGIRLAIHEMTGADIAVNWRKIFGVTYRQAEAQIVTCKAYFKTSATSWVNSMDVFIDWLLNSLYRLDASLGIYTLGKPGAVLNSTKLKAKFPELFRLFTLVHQKRYESNLSHPLVKSTQQPTKVIPFRWMTSTGAKALQRASEELHKHY